MGAVRAQGLQGGAVRRRGRRAVQRPVAAGLRLGGGLDPGRGEPRGPGRHGRRRQLRRQETQYVGWGYGEGGVLLVSLRGRLHSYLKNEDEPLGAADR